MNTDPLSEALDRLYAAPLEQFVAVRRELAGTLRASGDAAASKQLSSAVKPSRNAWALNQVARRRPELLSALFEARDRAAAVQKQGDSEAIRASVRIYRDCLAEAVQGARAAAAESGIDLGATHTRRIGETLQAACEPGSEARASLLAGRLAHDIDVEDPFAGLAGAAPKRHDEEQRERQARQARQSRQEAMARARELVATLERKAAEAHVAAREASISARRAQAEAERASRVAAEADEELQRARVEWQRLQE